jgi:hypothetical protein
MPDGKKKNMMAGRGKSPHINRERQWQPVAGCMPRQNKKKET